MVVGVSDPPGVKEGSSAEITVMESSPTIVCRIPTALGLSGGGVFSFLDDNGRWSLGARIDGKVASTSDHVVSRALLNWNADALVAWVLAVGGSNGR